MGLRISPEIIRKHFGSHAGHSPEARLKRRILWTIEDADDHGLDGQQVAMDLYGVGTRFGDLLILIDKDACDPAWMAAAKRTLRRIPRPLANPRARRAFHRMARTSNQNREALLEQLVPAAVMLALLRRSEPQRIRLGHDFIRTSHGSVALVAPESGWLMLEEFEGWLLKEVRNHLEADLLSEQHPQQNHDALDRAIPLGMTDHPSPDSAERCESGGFRAWLQSASPRERQLIDLIDSSANASNGEIARELQIAESTVRVMRHRLRKKWNRWNPEDPM